MQSRTRRTVFSLSTLWLCWVPVTRKLRLTQNDSCMLFIALKFKYAGDQGVLDTAIWDTVCMWPSLWHSRLLHQ